MFGKGVYNATEGNSSLRFTSGSVGTRGLGIENAEKPFTILLILNLRTMSVLRFNVDKSVNGAGAGIPTQGGKKNIMI